MKKNSDQTNTEATAPLKRMCSAFGCPELGTISSSNVGPGSDAQWFCRFHFGETSDKWPEITRARRLYWNDYVEPHKPKIDVTPAYIEKVKQELREFASSFGKPKDTKDWARKLRDKEESGQRLTEIQKQALRQALRFESDRSTL